MGILVRAIASAVLAVGFLLLVGYFQIRTEMLELGLVLTWDLSPSHLTEQRVAVLEHIILFFMFGVVAFLFLIRRRGLSGDTGIPALVGGLTLVAASGWYMATVGHLAQVPAEMNQLGLEFGWSTVIETGALSSMTHGMAALLLVIAILRFAQQRRPQKPTRDHETTEDAGTAF